SSSVNQEKRETQDAVERPPLLKSRPRPGSFQHRRSKRVPRILAPPPAPQRRNSAAADLISFGSPDSSPTSNNSPCPTWDDLDNIAKSTTSTFTVQTSTTSTFSSQTLFALNQTSIHFVGKELQNARPSYLDNSFMKSPFPLRDASTLDRSPVLSGMQAIQSAEQVASQMNVLKILEKKDNNNLIDLSIFETQGTSVRGSVLEDFDPLLSDSQREKIQADQKQVEKVAAVENK
ncbi:hypothetical protein L9F63_027605, partial [Diploptera punctata]